MPANYMAAYRPIACLSRRENKLPAKRLCSSRILLEESARQWCIAGTAEHILTVKSKDLQQMSTKGLDHSLWHHGGSVLATLAMSNGDDIGFKIDILYSELNAFVNSHSSAID